jgi:hypothetical protein
MNEETVTTMNVVRLIARAGTAGVFLFIAAVTTHGCANRAGDCEKNLTCPTGSGGQGGGIEGAPAEAVASSEAQ